MINPAILGFGGAALIAALLFAFVVSAIIGGIVFSFTLLRKKKFSKGFIALSFTILTPLIIHNILLVTNDNRKQSISEISLNVDSDKKTYTLSLDGENAKEKICLGEDVKFTFNFNGAHISDYAGRVHVDFRGIRGHAASIEIRGIEDSKKMEDYLKENFTNFEKSNPITIETGGISLILGSSKYGDYYIDMKE